MSSSYYSRNTEYNHSDGSSSSSDDDDDFLLQQLAHGTTTCDYCDTECHNSSVSGCTFCNVQYCSNECKRLDYQSHRRWCVVRQRTGRGRNDVISTTNTTDDFSSEDDDDNSSSSESEEEEEEEDIVVQPIKRRHKKKKMPHRPPPLAQVLLDVIVSPAPAPQKVVEYKEEEKPMILSPKKEVSTSIIIPEEQEEDEDDDMVIMCSSSTSLQNVIALHEEVPILSNDDGASFHEVDEYIPCTAEFIDTSNSTTSHQVATKVSYAGRFKIPEVYSTSKSIPATVSSSFEEDNMILNQEEHSLRRHLPVRKSSIVNAARRSIELLLAKRRESQMQRFNTPQWVPRSGVTNCNVCVKEFSSIWQKRHCYTCGHVVCRRCCSSSNSHSDNTTTTMMKKTISSVIKVFKKYRECDDCTGHDSSTSTSTSSTHSIPSEALETLNYM